MTSTGIQAQNRGEIRRSIGLNLGICLMGTATSTTDTTSLIDTTNLVGGDDEHNNKQVMIYDVTSGGSIVAGETKRVSDYSGSTQDATTSAFSNSITSGNKYEMWNFPWLIADINDAINQAIMEVSRKCQQAKQTATAYTERDKYEYNCLSSFTGLHTVEYVSSMGESEVLDECDSAWDGATGVTVTTDSEIHRSGSACNKLAVAASVSAGALFATKTISSTDLSNYDTIEFWICSSTAQTSTYLEFYLSSVAACASKTDTMSLPALTANTWTRVQLAMANPSSDTAIISIGIGQKASTDVGACTVFIDRIIALKAASREYKVLNQEYWGVVKGSTNYLRLTGTGRGITGQDTLLRLTGYQLPAMLSDDTTDSEIDPAYLIAQVSGTLASSHAKSSQLEINDRQNFARTWLSLAEVKKRQITTDYSQNTRWL